MDTYPEYLSCELDSRRGVSDSIRNSSFRRLRSKLENRTCIDCSSRNPSWVSLTYGVYLCLTCSGKHRRLGSHISFVRSTDMDIFTPEQILRMELGGNSKLRDFLREHGLLESKHADYQNNRILLKYKHQLDKELAAACEEYIRNKVDCNLVRENINSSEKNNYNTSYSTVPESAVPSSFPSALKKEGVAPPSVSSSPPIGFNNNNNNNNNNSNPNSSIKMIRPHLKQQCVIETERTHLEEKPHPPASSQSSIRSRKLQDDVNFDDLLSEATNTHSVAMPSPAEDKSDTQRLGIPSVSAVDAKPKSFPTYGSVSTTEAQPNRFQNAKSISSADYFNTSTGPDMASIYGSATERFGNSTAISSAGYFGEEEIPSKRNSFLNDATTAKLENWKESAKDGISALASASSDALARFGNWMGSS